MAESYTVHVRTDSASGSGISLGNGFFLTAAHVIEGSTQILVTAGLHPEREYVAQLVGVDFTRDMALIRSPALTAPAAELAGPDSLRTGDTVLAVGYPLALQDGTGEPTVTRGILSAYRTHPSSGVRYIQIDAPINPGNSGGPVTDSWGRLVGMTSFILGNSVGLSYAVAVGEVTHLLDGPQGWANCGTPYEIETLQVPARDGRELGADSPGPSAVLEGHLLVEDEELDIGFKVLQPPVDVVLDAGRARGRYDFEVSLPDGGSYRLVFDNGYSMLKEKSIIVYYRVRSR